MKRLTDIFVAFSVLLIFSPILLIVMLLVWLQDKHSPFFTPNRVGRNGEPFKMIKMRSMVINADALGGTSTANTDQRITGVGRFIRKFKIDELTQMWNVLKGEMSLVGPRPQTFEDAALYTEVEKGLMAARPGITDFSSIVFSDEGDILAGRDDPDLSYNQLIRPFKSRLGLFYIQHSSVAVDLRLVWLTILTVLARPKALAGVQALLKSLGADDELVQIASRVGPLVPTPPPGATSVWGSQ